MQYINMNDTLSRNIVSWRKKLKKALVKQEQLEKEGEMEVE